MRKFTNVKPIMNNFSKKKSAVKDILKWQIAECSADFEVFVEEKHMLEYLT